MYNFGSYLQQIVYTVITYTQKGSNGKTLILIW